MKTVMIVAGESSGEWYGSLLAKKLKALRPDVTVVGIGGERMRNAGVEILAGISSAFGIIELLPSLRRIRESYSAAKRTLINRRPDAVVLIDFPDFNFRLGRVAKEENLKVLYYVSPQVWAWRKGRIKTMGEIADRVAVILPFEEELYRRAGIPCEFVGHPAMEEIEEMADGEDPGDSLKSKARLDLGLTVGDPLVALLPGSRGNELKTLLPVFVEFVRAMRRRFPDARFVLPLAPNVEISKFGRYFDTLKKETVTIVKGDAPKCLAAADVAVIASGTATLQAALAGTPMVVVYRLSPLTYLIGKAILDTRHISLVNILGGKTIVRELLQGEANAETMCDEVERILRDDGYRKSMLSSMGAIRRLFTGRHPSQRVAEMIGEMAGN